MKPQHNEDPSWWVQLLWACLLVGGFFAVYFMAELVQFTEVFK